MGKSGLPDIIDAKYELCWPEGCGCIYQTNFENVPFSYRIQIHVCIKEYRIEGTWRVEALVDLANYHKFVKVSSAKYLVQY